MKVALLIVFAVGVVAYVIFGLRRRVSVGAPSGNNAKDDSCVGGDACGVSCFCDDKALERQVNEEIVYFDDEELDAYAGIAPDAYSESQIDEFSEVLTTLRREEVAEWLHSLQLRGITLPESLKDAVMLMME